MGLLGLVGATRKVATDIEADVVTQGVARLRRDGFSLDLPEGPAPLFHSGSSESWPGLAQLRALAPGMRLDFKGIEFPAGEGFFSRIQRHSDIGFGQGAEGFGTARAYFDRLNESPRYSIRNYSDSQLDRELSHFETVDRGDQRSLMGLHRARKRDPERFASRLRFLREEQQRRSTDTSPHYPVMFVLHPERMDPPPYLGGHYSARLPGERWIQQELPLKHMSYFAVPAEHLGHARAQVESIVPGASDRVVPIESFDAFAAGRKDVARARSSVNRTLRTVEARDWLRVNGRAPLL
jgi:hypothetical protein